MTGILDRIIIVAVFALLFAIVIGAGWRWPVGVN